MNTTAYGRKEAVAYARKWAYSRNPAYYDFSELGGDCTNFASQCLYAGGKAMNYQPVYGWYYVNLHNRAPAWTSVEYLFRFLTGNEGPGPYAVETGPAGVRPGDIVQLRFIGNGNFSHSPVVTSVRAPTMEGILTAAHSSDCFDRPLSSYQNVAQVRYLHIVGVRMG